MSSAGTVAVVAPKVDFLSVVAADFKAAEGWAEATAEGVAVTVWSTFKTGIIGVTAGQAQIILNVLGRLNTDIIAKMTIEQIETDLLNLALVSELALLQSIESRVLQLFIAAWKAS